MAFMAMLHACAAAARRCTKKSPCFMLGSKAPHGDASSCHRAHLVVAFAGLVLLGLLLAPGHVPGTISHGLHWEREGQGTLVQQPATSSTPATSDISHPCLCRMCLCYFMLFRCYTHRDLAGWPSGCSLRACCLGTRWLHMKGVAHSLQSQVDVCSEGLSGSWHRPALVAMTQDMDTISCKRRGCCRAW